VLDALRSAPYLLTGPAAAAPAAAAVAAVKDVLEGVCILMGVKPTITRKKDAKTGSTVLVTN
jgi:hypothetical protein